MTQDSRSHESWQGIPPEVRQLRGRLGAYRQQEHHDPREDHRAEAARKASQVERQLKEYQVRRLRAKAAALQAEVDAGTITVRGDDAGLWAQNIAGYYADGTQGLLDEIKAAALAADESVADLVRHLARKVDGLPDDAVEAVVEWVLAELRVTDGEVAE